MGVGVICGPYLPGSALERQYGEAKAAAVPPQSKTEGVFFVTGFPRSRTGWMANLLSVPGVSLCVHDVVGGCGGVEDLRGIVGGAVALPGKEGKYLYRGVSDPGLALVWREVAAGWPGAKWVHIYRDVFEAARSFAGFLEKHGWGLPWEQVRSVMLRWERELAELESALAFDACRVGFEELDDVDRVEEVWKWLMTGVEFDRERFEVLRRLNVQTMPGKAPFGPEHEGWRRWMERAAEGNVGGTPTGATGTVALHGTEKKKEEEVWA